MPLPASDGSARRRGSERLLSLGLAASLLLVACAGGGADNPGGGGGGGGGGGNGAYDPVIAQIQSSFGNSMVSGTVDAGTLKIVLITGAGEGMAKLFMCANVKPYLKAANLADTKVIISDQSGVVLATEAVCK
jgi:hypothetical protein